MNKLKRNEVEPYSVYCFCIDMIGSTQMGLKLTTQQFYRFNRELVEQIKPHLEKLNFLDSLIKFTGDGWLLMTTDDKTFDGKKHKNVPVLCCFATIMASIFQSEMAEKMNMTSNRIPPLKLAICSGCDIRVQLPDKQLPDKRMDWVGDSARKAVRTSMLCYPNEILIDEPTLNWVQRDFNTRHVNIRKRIEELNVKKNEEEFPRSLFSLGDLKSEVISDPEAQEYFVYTFDVIVYWFSVKRTLSTYG